MIDKYQVVSNRGEIAIYYFWEYGLKGALKQLKLLKKCGCYFLINPISFDTFRTKKSSEIFAKRVSEVVLSYKAIKSKRFDQSTCVHVVKKGFKNENN